jgi:chloramphenicol-sensitive protein RarD
MIGMMQYLSPTIQLLLGVFIYHEYFDAARLLGFCIIWLSLFLYTAESLRNQRRMRLAPA